VKEPISDPLEDGAIIGGSYRVTRPIAVAGTGIVYDTVEMATGVRRAVEVISGHPFPTDELRARFNREVRLAAQIPTDHVVHPTGTGRDEATGALYVVTEPLDGSMLSSVLAHSGPLPRTAALTVLEHVADALGAAHTRGLVHRALTPASLFLANAPAADVPFTVKVVELGFAKILGPSPDPSTLAWCAPELMTPGATVRPPADVWSFGLLAFRLLAGRHYFPSANLASPSRPTLLGEVMGEALAAPSLRASGMGVGGALPPSFDEWFARCVNRDPSGRFSDIRAAYRELASVARPTSTALIVAPPADGPPRVDARWRWAGPLLVAAAAVAGALGALFVVARSRSEESAGAAAASLGSGETSATSPSLRLHGSNTIGAELAPALAEAFLKRRTAAPTIVRRTAPDETVVEAREGTRTVDAIAIEAHGTATGFRDLADGRCDVAMASRRIRDDEASAAAQSGRGALSSAAAEHVIALDGIAVIVNPVNPVSSLTDRQIGDIFAGKLLRWSDVYWKPDLIVVHARDDRSGTYDTFKQLALGGRAIAAGARRHESSEELSDAVAADPYAIGFIGLPYVRSAKAIMVQVEGSVPLLPSPLTVSTEDYPLARRLYLYSPLGATAAAHDFVDFAQSEEGQRVVGAAGFVDLRAECDERDERNANPCPSCPPEYRAIVAGACRLSVDFRFVRGGTQLDTRALRDLERLAALVKRPGYARRSITLLGFADASGAPAASMALSEERVGIVADQLRARGIHVDVARGFGSEMAVADSTTAEGRERNRRVEIWLR
jgi:phosphate transport system substrate-binding protein